MRLGERWTHLPFGVRLLVVAAVYYASARLGLRLALVDDIVTPLWPPTGVAVVALAAFGYSFWPAIAFAAFAVNVSLADTALDAGVIAVGNTLAPLAGAFLLRRLGFDSTLNRRRDAIVLVIVALLTMAISASVGTAVVADDSAASVADTWWVWWAGDAMGVLLVAPFLWSLVRVRFEARPDWARVFEAAALFVALAGVTYVSSKTAFLFVVLPLLGAIAWRFQQLGAAPAALLASVIVIEAAADGQGIFEGETLLYRMVLLQAFNASLALTSFVFAAAVTERRDLLHALYQREHRIAETLQRSLLPQLPELPGVAVAARYLPSSHESQVAGDWYDVISLSGDRFGLVVGDVVGHGLSAAAAMAQIRMGLRAYAMAGSGPAATLTAVNRMVVDLHPGTMATLLYVEYDPGVSEARVACAGHPAPLMAGPQTNYLECPPGVPIGVQSELVCDEAVHPIAEGSTLVLFTDGLVERRGEPIDRGLATLAAAGDAAHALDVDALCDHVIDVMGVGASTDDIALLAVRPTSLAGESLRLRRPATPAAVSDVRRVLRRWLRENGAAEDEAYELLLATSEAQTNAVKHAYRQPEGVVEVEASIDAGVVTVTVRDQGTWRDTFTESDGGGGRGIPLIRSFTDLESHSDAAGTTVRMRRRLSPPVS